MGKVIWETIKKLYSWLIDQGLFGTPETWTDYWASWIILTFITACFLAAFNKLFHLTKGETIIKWWFLLCPFFGLPLLVRPTVEKLYQKTWGKNRKEKEKLAKALEKVEEDQYKAVIKEEQAKLLAASGYKEDVRTKKIRAAFQKKTKAAEAKKTKADAKQARKEAAQAAKAAGDEAPLSVIEARQARIAKRKAATEARIAERDAATEARIAERDARADRRAGR